MALDLFKECGFSADKGLPDTRDGRSVVADIRIQRWVTASVADDFTNALVSNIKNKDFPTGTPFKTLFGKIEALGRDIGGSAY